MDLAHSAIVCAHPDDEILWFGGALPRVGQTIIAYGDNPRVPDCGAQRRRAMASFPGGFTLDFLDLPEPKMRPVHLVDTHTGLETVIEPQPEENCQSLLASRLRAALKPDTRSFLTHNPWGEYGHKDHLRVHAVVTAMAAELGLPVFVSSYLAARAVPHCRRTMENGISFGFEANVDQALVKTIQRHYTSHGCWTWNDDWQWPEIDSFLEVDFRRLSDRSVPLRFFDWPRRPDGPSNPSEG